MSTQAIKATVDLNILMTPDMTDFPNSNPAQYAVFRIAFQAPLNLLSQFLHKSATCITATTISGSMGTNIQVDLFQNDPAR